MVQKFNSLGSKPDIVISTGDYRRLSNLLAVQRHRFAEAAFALQAELDRARIMPVVPLHVVQMGSTVEFRSDVAPQKPVTLVFPQDADISAGRISILTPIGAALIGLSPGQSIHWEARDGAVRELAVVRVEPPGDTYAHPGDGAGASATSAEVSLKC
jgi:regulator of nucleoside diphosphate kinase